MKRYKALLHDILVEIRRTHNRYLSILCIVLLGVGFFAGIKSTCPDMKETAQQYFEDQNLMDMHLKSSMGFTEEDVDSLKAQEDIACVSPSYSVDAFVEPAEGDPMLVRAWSWEIGAQDDEDTVNMPVLKEGRWPEKENECLVEHGMYSGESFQVGQTITLFLEEGDLSESLKTQTFTIVGVVESPMYINFERGSSSVGNGSIRSFLYLPEDAFAYEVYTDVFLTYKDTQGLPFYEDEYRSSWPKSRSRPATTTFTTKPKAPLMRLRRSWMKASPNTKKTKPCLSSRLPMPKASWKAPKSRSRTMKACCKASRNSWKAARPSTVPPSVSGRPRTRPLPMGKPNWPREKANGKAFPLWCRVYGG